MPEPLQFFKYSGPDAPGGRDTAEGRRSYPMAMTDNVVSTVQIFKKGVHNRLHVHLTEDGYWFVLGGEVTFYGEGDTELATLEHSGGIYIPRNTRYWFENNGTEQLVMVRCASKDKGVGDDRVYVS